MDDLYSLRVIDLRYIMRSFAVAGKSVLLYGASALVQLSTTIISTFLGNTRMLLAAIYYFFVKMQGACLTKGVQLNPESFSLLLFF